MFKKIILLFISFIFISYTVFAVADQKYLIDELVKQRYHKKISEDIQLEDNYIGTLNKKGILLKEYYISDLGDKQLPQILSFQVPFVAVKNGTFLLIEKIEINGQRKFVKAKNEYGDIEKIEWKKFINGWDGKI